MVVAVEVLSPTVTAIARTPTIFLRQQSDSRISLHEEKRSGKEVVQALLTLVGEQHPYTFTLGWLTPVAAEKGPECVDELEQTLPMPGEKQGKLDKVDFHSIRGFDLVSGGKLNQALKEFEEAVEFPQSNPRFYNNLGACLAALGELDKAEKQLALAVKMQPNYAVAHTNLAWLNLAKGNFDRSLSDARQALQVDSELRPARFAAVQAQIALGQLDGALKVSEDTVRRWPADPQAIMVSGDTLSAGGDYKNARQRYLKALLVLPNNPQLLLKSAHMSQMLGDLDDALKRARQATTVAPELADGHLALGRYLEMNRDERAAQIQFERALDLSPPLATKVAIYGPYLRVLISMNKLDDADKLSRKWISANPESADCHYNRAWVAGQLPGKKSTAEAIQEYRKSLALKHDLVQAHYNVALLLIKQGNSSEASKELKEFIRLAPQDPDISNAQKLLAQLSHSG